MPTFANKASFDDAVVLRETAAAILVSIPGHGEAWIPQSQVDDDSEIWKQDDRGTLIVSQWIAEERQLV